MRRTLAHAVSFQGPALFSGQDARMTIHPAQPGTGIRMQLGTHTPPAPATLDHLSDQPAHPAFANQRPRCTSLAVGTRTIAMTEHTLAALAGLGITDAIIESHTTELPILDGSSQPITNAISEITTLVGTIEPITLRHPIELRTEHAVISGEPCDAIDYTYHLDYGPDAPIPASHAQWTGDPEDFRRSIAPARTFSTEDEARHAHEAGLFTRFTPADLLVIGHTGPIDNTLRFADEPARHKLLDLIGDLALLGRPLHARIHATRSGHADTHAFARLILEHLADA